MDVGSAAGLRAIGGGLVSPALGLMLLAATTAIALLVLRVRQSGLGNRLLAVRSNESAAAAAGVSVRHTKFTAYALSSCIAGVGGVAYAYAFTKVTVDSFGILVALQFVAFAYIGGITMIPGAVFAGLMTTGGVIPHFLDAQLGLSQTWILLVAGVALILCLRLFPAGIAGSLEGRSRQAAATRRRRAASRPGRSPELATVVPAELGRAVVADGVARAGDVVGLGEQPQARLLQADELLGTGSGLIAVTVRKLRWKAETLIPARAARSPTAKRSVWWSRIQPITPLMWVRLLSARPSARTVSALLAVHEPPDDLALEHRREDRRVVGAVVKQPQHAHDRVEQLRRRPGHGDARGRGGAARPGIEQQGRDDRRAQREPRSPARPP